MAKASNSTNGRRRFLSFIPFLATATVAGPVVAVSHEPIAGLWQERERRRLDAETALEALNRATGEGVQGVAFDALEEAVYPALNALRDAHARVIETRAGTPAGVQLKLRLVAESMRSGEFYNAQHGGFFELLESAIKDLGCLQVGR